VTHADRSRRKADIRRRLTEGRAGPRPCRVAGCRRLATAATGRGFNRLYCRQHEEHFERHGSYTKRSYTAAELRPHWKTALGWLRGHRDDPAVVRAVRAIQALYQAAGSVIEANRLTGLPPDARARAAWARLRASEVDPFRPLGAWLALDAASRVDPQPEHRSEFRRVQAAKLVHRMASGTHRHWQRPRPDGGLESIERHWFPHSRGRVLRHLGEQIERATELLVEPFRASLKQE
jgi:hypothetical protein